MEHALVEHIVSRLVPYYPMQEARDLAYWIIEETTGMNRFEVHLHQDHLTIPNLDGIIEQLRDYVPIQYVFGHTEWLGLDLQVSEATLIPRPETAELVELVERSAISNQKAEIRILDIGTGSGCIALALKQRHPEWQIEGLDKSHEALAVAAANAKNLGLNVHFYEADILRDDICNYDVIVSNPPYIRPSERNSMTQNTLRHEPEEALFVPDNDPLLFYRRIAELRRAPELWFEISETQGEAMLNLMHQLNYGAECLKDIYGKQRFIHATNRR